MWPNIKKQFDRKTVRPEIVKKMIECGMCISDDRKILVGGVEVDYSALAKAIQVDRRVVRQTVDQIAENPFLYSVFSKVRPMGTSLLDLVSVLGYSAIIVEANPKEPGVMASVAGILSNHGMVVRQAIAEDPDMVLDARMTLVVEGQIPGAALQELNSLRSVRSIKILK